jgi:non-heme chloroperoxidase
MGTITTTDGTEIFFKDWGSGQPIVFSHGWPLSADDWDTQMLFFLQHGYRVIAHDRRGHGRSTQTGDGHDMDHYADDLAALTAHLDLHGRRPRRTLHRRRRSSCGTSRGTARAASRWRC